MNASGPVLLAAAAGVGFAHAVLPDHWMPLAVVGRSQRWSVRRIARLSGIAGIGHVLLSIVLGAVVIAAGLPLRHTVASAQDAIVGGLLILTGVAFAVLQVRGHSHDHSPPHDHAHRHPHSHDHRHHHEPGAHAHDRPPSRLALLIPFGAAASPDLTILPVFLAATTAGAATAVGTVILFGAVTIVTIVALTTAAALGVLRLKGDWLERYGNAITAGVLIAIGGLIAAGVI